jgi:quaternary ammonium compound-resistance protein SugE
MAWTYLLLAGFFEIAWAIGLKYTEGWTRLWPSMLTILGMAASFYCLSAALTKIPMGTAYAIWTGIGAVGAAVFGVLLFGDAFSWTRMGCVALIVAGIVGLKLFN